MFYKYENEELLYGEIVTFVDGEIPMLILEEKDLYPYPVNGWYYFATEEEARTFFNIQD